jgi:hypothetical protein
MGRKMALIDEVFLQQFHSGLAGDAVSCGN